MSDISGADSTLNRRITYPKDDQFMILMYHKVDIVTPSKWWVSVEKFERQIRALQKRGFEFVYLDDHESSNKKHVVLTFDDAYENIYRHAFPYLKNKQIPFEVFIMGDLLEEWNDFDRFEMKTRFCSLEHLKEMARFGGRIQWHTRSHAQLPKLSCEEMELQLTVNPGLRSEFPPPHFQWFAYPSGMHDPHSVAQVRKKFHGALSVDDGSSTDRFQLNRVTVDENWMPA